MEKSLIQFSEVYRSGELSLIQLNGITLWFHAVEGRCLALVFVLAVNERHCNGVLTRIAELSPEINVRRITTPHLGIPKREPTDGAMPEVREVSLARQSALSDQLRECRLDLVDVCNQLRIRVGTNLL